MRLAPTVACVAAGGSVGALARWAAPWPIVVTNVLGCALMGVLLVWLERRMPRPWARPTLAVGFLGGFTTFSTYAVDVAAPGAAGATTSALVGLALTPVLALAALAAGVVCARLVVPPRTSS